MGKVPLDSRVKNSSNKLNRKLKEEDEKNDE